MARPVMTSKERVLATLRQQPTDRVSVHHITFSSRVASALLGRDAHVGGGMQQWREACALWHGPDAHTEFIERSYRDAIDLAKTVGNDIARVTYWRMPTKPSERVDENTFRYGARRVMRFDPATELYQDVGGGDRITLSLSDIEASVARAEAGVADYTPSEAEFATEARAQREIGDETVVRVGGVGISIPYDEAWLHALAASPSLVARHLDTQTERAVRRLDLLRDLGFTCIWGGGDLAWNDGPFYSPRTFHELMLPRLRCISDECHARGLLRLFGSDGDLWPIAPDLFGASGVDGLYEADRVAGMDLRRLRREYPNLTPIGNISSHTLHRGSVEDVVAETRDCLDVAHECGGVIVGCSNLVMPETPMANVDAMISTLQSGVFR